jgi:hypothetical protein
LAINNAVQNLIMVTCDSYANKREKEKEQVQRKEALREALLIAQEKLLLIMKQ